MNLPPTAWMPLLAGLLLASAGPASPGSPSEPSAAELQALVEWCDACHGPAGRSVRADVPSLAGQDTATLMAALTRFHSYERHCPATRPRDGDSRAGPQNMCEVSGRMTEPQARALAEFYAALPTRTGPD